jgi:hypothetical protein
VLPLSVLSSSSSSALQKPCSFCASLADSVPRFVRLGFCLGFSSTLVSGFPPFARCFDLATWQPTGIIASDIAPDITLVTQHSDCGFLLGTRFLGQPLSS